MTPRGGKKHFPRRHNRGPIEANSGEVPSSFCERPFRDPRVAAPLTGREDLVRFILLPRSNIRRIGTRYKIFESLNFYC